MKVCDKCKGKSKDFKDFGIHGEIKIGEQTYDLCQDCFFKAYKYITGEPFDRPSNKW